MKRLLLPLTASLCLLTACPGPAPELLKIPDGPAALNGVWQGTVYSSVNWQPVAAGGGLLYVVASEQALPARFDDVQPPRSAQFLVALDERTGQEVRRVPWSDVVSSFTFQAASGTRPARLLSIEAKNSRVGVMERDPRTLEELDHWGVAEGVRRFSHDGTRLELTSERLLDPQTRQLVPLHPAVDTALRQLPKEAEASWSGDLRWLTIRRWEQPSSGRVERVSLISNDTGQTLDGRALHPVGCGLNSPGGRSGLTAVRALSDGEVALAYEDGAIEVRRSDGTLRVTVQLGVCSDTDLRVDGDTLMFAVQGGFGTVRLSDGQVASRVKQDGVLGLLLPGAAVNRFGTTLLYQRLDGPSWRQVAPAKPLHLDAKATWVSKSEYHVTGEARIDDQRLSFTAKATTTAIELRAQWSYPRPEVQWRGELRRSDGSLYGRLEGNHGSASTEQQVFLELAGKAQDFAFGGRLIR
ncbi:hypothetical protein E7T06_18750 [Deinococcus sp. Arct2-2]|uniref:hypothetical protein n=1 Tax=Deinococcus sp. Arct2-2 TaxID=2568653 RepID=UPI0010A4A00F|nr:hypothetical protein [Deinococcus sp. Arct2-2]THF67915.1 hypothetical protein E7T06_18750 [Deinococcus sp. Arct2-2]